MMSKPRDSVIPDAMLLPLPYIETTFISNEHTSNDWRPRQIYLDNSKMLSILYKPFRLIRSIKAKRIREFLVAKTPFFIRASPMTNQYIFNAHVWCAEIATNIESNDE